MSKVTNFNLPHRYLPSRWGWPVEFSRYHWHHKNKSHWAIMWRFSAWFYDSTFSSFSINAYLWWTDGQTHDDGVYTALAQRRAVKTGSTYALTSKEDRTTAQQQTTRIENSVKFVHAVFEICSRTDCRQTDWQTHWLQYWHYYQTNTISSRDIGKTVDDTQQMIFSSTSLVIQVEQSVRYVCLCVAVT